MTPGERLEEAARWLGDGLGRGAQKSIWAIGSDTIFLRPGRLIEIHPSFCNRIKRAASSSRASSISHHPARSTGYAIQTGLTRH